MTINPCWILQQILWVVTPFRLWRLPVQRWPVERSVCQLSGPIATWQRVHLWRLPFRMCIQGTGTGILALLSCVWREGPLCFFVVLVVVVLPPPRGAVSMGKTRWRSRWCEDTRLYGKVGRLSLIALSVVDSLAQSFLVIDRSSSISQVHVFNTTDSCYRMTRKLNESNVGWQSSTQAPILEVGWINILCSILNFKAVL